MTECDVEDLCLNLIDGSWPGVAFEVVLAAYCFVGIAVVADEHLAPSLETLCHRLKLSEDVAGASFLALGSAAPEIIIASVSTVKSIVAGEATEAADFAQSLGISSILGSGMMAFTLIPGLCAMSVPKPMLLKRRPLARDAIIYTGSLAFLFYIIDKGRCEWTDACAMLLLYFIYLSLTAMAPAARECYRTRCLGKEAHSTPMEKGDAAELEDALNGEADDDDDDDDGPLQWYQVPFVPVGAILKRTCPECEVGSETEHLYPITMTVAFAWLALFSTILSAAITRWGTLLNVPGTTMGMFIIAVGAQIPDTVQAIAVAKRGMGSMAVASAVGSQVMNILIGLGLPWTIST
jgi:sodium/potassium/calcium exchanger 5